MTQSMVVAVVIAVTCFLSMSMVGAVPVPVPVPAPVATLTCTKGDPGVSCLINPCMDISKKCAVPKGVVCIPNYCSKPTTYHRQTVAGGPCSFILVDIATQKIVPCKPPCPSLYRPVCGSDGKTYINACVARKAEVKYNAGACIVQPCALCVKDKVCPKSKSPCKGNRRLRCQLNSCGQQHVTESGKVVVVPACSLAYFNKVTGYIKPSCTV